VRLLDLPVVGLQQVRARAVQHADLPVGQRRRVLIRLGAVGQPRAVHAARLDPHDLRRSNDYAARCSAVHRVATRVCHGRANLHARVAEEGGEHADRVGPAAHARDDRVREPARPVVERRVACVHVRGT
jgi:hypothetical protein